LTVAFDIERFERIDASSGTALLRVAGTFTSEAETTLGAPELLIDDGRDARRVTSLPDPAANCPASCSTRDGSRSPCRLPAPASSTCPGPRAQVAGAG